MSMYQQDADLDYHVNRLYDQLADADRTLPVELKAAVHKELEPIDGLLESHTADDGHLEFTIDYVSRESERWRDDDLDEDEEREEPPCTCDDRWCEYKWGKLPKRAREADSLEEIARTENREHDGRPNVVFEAKEERREERGSLMTTVRKCRIALVNRVHPEKIEEWGSMTAAEYADALEGDDGSGVGDRQ